MDSEISRDARRTDSELSRDVRQTAISRRVRQMDSATTTQYEADHDISRGV